jgi:hypothetical protein
MTKKDNDKSYIFFIKKKPLVKSQRLLLGDMMGKKGSTRLLLGDMIGRKGSTRNESNIQLQTRKQDHVKREFHEN